MDKTTALVLADIFKLAASRTAVAVGAVAIVLFVTLVEPPQILTLLIGTLWGLSLGAGASLQVLDERFPDD